MTSTRILDAVSKGDVEALRLWLRTQKRENRDYLTVIREVFKDEFKALSDLEHLGDVLNYMTCQFLRHFQFEIQDERALWETDRVTFKSELIPEEQDPDATMAAFNDLYYNFRVHIHFEDKNLPPHTLIDIEEMMSAVDKVCKRSDPFRFNDFYSDYFLQNYYEGIAILAARRQGYDRAAIGNVIEGGYYNRIRREIYFDMTLFKEGQSNFNLHVGHLSPIEEFEAQIRLVEAQIKDAQS